MFTLHCSSCVILQLPILELIFFLLIFPWNTQSAYHQQEDTGLHIQCNVLMFLLHYFTTVRAYRTHKTYKT